MHGRFTRGLAGLVALGLAAAPLAASAGSFDCSARRLEAAERAICVDSHLFRTDEHLLRRLSGFTHRLTFGQYLGLRYWHARWSDERIGCQDDRSCIAATYRTQNRLLDGLELCLDSSARRRSCLQATLGEREARRR
jgi:uncharacterized protein